MPKFGTIEVYEEMAEILNNDTEWSEMGKDISYTMVFNYQEPVGKTFFLRFDAGRVTEVREIPSPDAEAADFVISGDPETWRGVLEKQVNPTMAFMRGKLKLKGEMSTLMKHMKPFNHILESMSRIELV